MSSIKFIAYFIFDFELHKHDQGIMEDLYCEVGLVCPAYLNVIGVFAAGLC
jgi:hypothetical protein